MYGAIRKYIIKTQGLQIKEKKEPQKYEEGYYKRRDYEYF